VEVGHSVEWDMVGVGCGQVGCGGMRSGWVRVGGDPLLLFGESGGGLW
jgi:hypothetical protein